MKLPKHFVEEGLRLAKGSYLFGVRFCDMTTSELVAAAAQGWNAQLRAREEGHKQLMSTIDLMGNRR